MLETGSRPRRGRGVALALALTATTALAAPVAAHAAAPPAPAAVAAPIDAGGPAQHADHADQKSQRTGAWRALAGAMSGIGSAVGGLWLLVRRAAGAKIVKPVVKAAAATARVAIAGASVMGRVGLWAGRAVIGLIMGALGLLAALSGLANAGGGGTLLAGALLGAGATAAMLWSARRLVRFGRSA